MEQLKWRSCLPPGLRNRAFSFLPVLTLLLAIGVSGPGKAVAATAAESYGVVEIGSRGVRGFAFDLDGAKRQECQADEERYTACLNMRSTQSRNVSPGQSDDIKRTVAAIAATAEDLQQSGVPSRNLYIVGSSGAAKGEMRDLLALEIQNGLKPVNGVSFVTADEEATYGFEGVLNLIPRAFREQRRRQAVLVDVGGGNTKGAYLDLASGTPKITTFSVPWGTNSATEDIQKIRGDKDFSTAATMWRKEQFVSRLRMALQNRQGITNRERFYLIGGTPWALSTLTRPESKQRFPQIRQADVERLYNDASAADGSVRLCTANRYRKPGSDIERVCDIFSMNNLIAGTQILVGLFQELDMGANGKHVFFMRDSQFAWPLGYLGDRLGVTTRK